MDNPQNIISFCTGYGGIELGLRLAGEDVRTVAACEIETYAVANLVAKMEQGSLEPFPVWTDLKTFDGRPFRGKVHGLIGGYPCQPFSCAGRRKGTDDPRHLWPYILDHIRTIRPVWCFFENVAGHLTLGFEEVFKSLRDLGYQVEAGLFAACECVETETLEIACDCGGVFKMQQCSCPPHKRQRLFILAIASELKGRLHTEGRVCHTKARSASEKQLGDTAGIGLEEQRPQRRDQVEFNRAGEQLADTEEQRIQGSRAQGQQEPEISVGKEISRCNCRGIRWPARPGQEQYGWEEPRTVKPSVGEPTYGTACGLVLNSKWLRNTRVDMLRMLGNGVVPQCAAKAWITLWEQMS